MKNILFLFVILISFNIFYGNDGYYRTYPVFGEITMLTNDSIQMVSEVVIYKDERFTTVFNFSNTSSEYKTVTVGFPVDGNYDISEGAGLSEEEVYFEIGLNEEQILEDRTEKSKSFQFESFINDVEFERETMILPLEDDYDFIYYSDVEFQPHESIIISNSYMQTPYHSVATGGHDYYYIKYILKTGASWKDSIQRSEIIFYIPKYIHNSNANIKINENSISYDLGILSGEQKIFEFKDFYYGFVTLLKYSIDIQSYSNQSKITENNSEYIIYWDLRNIEPDENITVKWGYNDFLKHFDFFESLTNSVYSKNPESFFILYPEFEEVFQDQYVFHDFIFQLLKTLKKETHHNNDHLAISRRFLINSLSAIYGYKFSSIEWKTFFEYLDWYEPITSDPVYSDFETEMIRLMKLSDAYSNEMEIEISYPFLDFENSDNNINKFQTTNNSNSFDIKLVLLIVSALILIFILVFLIRKLQV